MSRLIFAIRNTLAGKSLGSLIHHNTASTLSVIVHRKNNSAPQHRYGPGGYHPVLAGEVYNQRYRVVRQLGWGLYSTVWLVQDIQDQRLAAMKILIGDLSIPSKRGDWDEPGILKVLQKSDPHSSGYGHICHLHDQGPNGNHICLVLEAMGLSVLDLYGALPSAMPLELLKRVCKHVLCALQYLHEECGIIHTDIKGDNILMTGVPSEERLDIELDNDYLMSTTFKLSDFGAVNMISNRFADVIQPESLRSPEVIGIYEFARGTKLFDLYWDNEKSGMNTTQTHLSQITGLCGDFPLEFLNSGRKSKLYFDDQGSLLRGAGRYSITLYDLLSRAGHPAEQLCEVSEFLTFVLTINPEDRRSAARLLGHPWLKNVE